MSTTTPEPNQATELAPIILILSDFQAGEMDHGLGIDAADHPDEPEWGMLTIIGTTRSKRARLVIAGTQLARDRALYRITSSRDIFADNAAGSSGTPEERMTASSRARSLASLIRKLTEAAGGPEGFSPDVRRWITR